MIDNPFKDKFNVDSVDELTLKEKYSLVRIMAVTKSRDMLNKKQIKLGNQVLEWFYSR